MCIIGINVDKRGYMLDPTIHRLPHLKEAPNTTGQGQLLGNPSMDPGPSGNLEGSEGHPWNPTPHQTP